jgi:hypothetical protein
VELRPDRKLGRFRKLPEVATTGFETTKSKDLPWSKWFPPEKTGFYLPSRTDESPPDSADTSVPVLEVVHDRFRTPPDAYDAVGVWKGVDAETDQEFFVEAAAYQGRPVYYEYFTADQFRQANKPVDEGPTQTELGLILANYLFLGAIIVAIGLTIFYLLSGRGDRRGALRLAMAVFLLFMTTWLTLAHHSVGVLELSVLVLGLA